MKKKMTMLLLSGAWSISILSAQDGIPSKIAGDMKISSEAVMHFSGNAQVDMSANHGSSGKILNEGTLKLPKGITFVSDDHTDGMLLNKNEVELTSEPSEVKVIKRFKEGAGFYSVSFPFDVDASEISGETETLEFEKDFLIKGYNSESRALNGYGDHNDPWEWLPETPGDPLTLKAGIGYMIYIKKSMNLVFPAKTLPEDLFHSTNPKKMTAKYYCSHMQNDFDNGWVFIGNQKSTSFHLIHDHLESYTQLDELPSFGFAYFYDKSKNDWTITHDLDPRAEDDDVLMSPYVGFFTQLKGNEHGQDIEFGFLSSGRRLNNSHPNLRSGISNTYDALELKLQKEGDSTFDKLRVVMGDEYSDSFQIGEDAPKMLSAITSQFYTLLEGAPIIFNKMKPTTDEIPVGVKIREAGHYTISINDQKGFEDARFYLIDKQTNREYDLSNEDYVFDSEAVSTDDRYALRILKGATSTEMVESSGILVYTNNKTVHVRNIEAGDQVTIYSISGQLVEKETTTSDSYVKELPEGVYVVSVTNSGSNHSTKIVNR